MPRRRWQITIVVALLIILFLIAWTPHVVSNPRLDASETFEAVMQPPAPVATTLRKSCNNCHSNRTAWPWYAHLRPIAAKIRSDVANGRRALNFSKWKMQIAGDVQLQKKTLETSCVLMQAGMMPPSYYLYIHPNAKLTRAEIQQFCGWAHSLPSSTRARE